MTRKVLTQSDFITYAVGPIPCFSGFNGRPKMRSGSTVLPTKCGLRSSWPNPSAGPQTTQSPPSGAQRWRLTINLQNALSPCALLALYVANIRSGPYGGGCHAASTSTVFHISAVKSYRSFQRCCWMADELEQRTKRFIWGSVIAASSALVRKRRVEVMTTLGSGDMERLEARWARASQPEGASW